MQNKFKFNYVLFLVIGAFVISTPYGARADIESEIDELTQQQSSADAVADYEVSGSLFEQITTLEQQKVLMQLEKEKAQLDLELDKLAAEKIKLHMEIDNLSGRAEQQQQELETERKKLEVEAARLLKEQEKINKSIDEEKSSYQNVSVVSKAPANDSIGARYKLVNVYGVGNQLQTTLTDLSTGQNKKLSVGKKLDGYTVKSISVDDGVVFVKGDVVETLNVAK